MKLRAFCTKKVRRLINLRMVVVLVMTLAMIGCGSSDDVYVVATEGPAQTNAGIEGLVIAAPVTTVDPADASKSYVSVSMLTQGKVATIKTESIASANVSKLTANLIKGALVGYQKHATLADVAKIPTDASKTFTQVLAGMGKVSLFGGAWYIFDSMKYGPEMPAIDKVPGNLVAAGWIYAKDTTKKTITVGDGRIVTKDMAGRAYEEPIKRYEETYKLADNVVVYNVNTTDYTKSAVSTLAALPVTADYNYSTTSRQQVFCVFDKNINGADSAKITAIYYANPKSTADGKPVWDVPTRTSMLENMGTVPPSESATYAGQKYVDIEFTKGQNYTGSTEPFEIVKDTFYYVGDNEVALYLFKTKDKLILLDTGWPASAYSYWKNIEAMGFDPRKITDIMMSHGHGDHYGCVVELITMIENSGNKVTLWGSKEDDKGLTLDAQGNIWNRIGTLPASETLIRAKTSVYYESEKTYDFGNVQMTLLLTPGHSTGAYSFFFKVQNPSDQKWYTFGYHGGSGSTGMYTNTNTTGWARLTLQMSLAYLQMKATSDLVAPQHTNQYPIVEVYQAVKAWNNDPANANNKKTLLDAMLTNTGDVNEYYNFCEKRYQVLTNPVSDVLTPSHAGVYTSIENYGPFKPGRENGLTNVSINVLDDPKIIRGFNKYQNINSNYPLLKNGVAVFKDSYVHDPDAYYVQVYANVLDDATYQGYLPDGYQQTIDGVVLTYVGGPIESLYKGTGTPEPIRSQRLSSLADAQAVLATVTKGRTYKVNLTKASAIIVPADVTKTFTPVP